MKTINKAMLTLALATVALNSFARLSYDEVRREARFLTDRMRYELRLSVAQFDDVYEINYDFLWNVNEIIDDVIYGYDDAVDYYYYLLDVRNEDLSYVLRRSQYRRFLARDYFYRPIYNAGSYWAFRIYLHYTDRTFFHYGVPSPFDHYAGAHYRLHYPNGYYNDRYHFLRYKGDFRTWKPGGYGNDYGDGMKGNGHMSGKEWSNRANYETSRKNNTALSGSTISSRAGVAENSRSANTRSVNTNATSSRSATTGNARSAATESTRSTSGVTNSRAAGNNTVNRAGATTTERSSTSTSRSTGTTSASSRSGSSVSSSRSSGTSSSSSSTRSGSTSSSSRSGSSSSSSRSGSSRGR